jgi:hypothetical protein
MRSITTLWALISISVTSSLAQVTLPIKQVVAPPADIINGILQLPELIELGESSRTLLLEISLAQANAHGIIEAGFPLRLGHDRGRVVFLPATPGAWEVSLDVVLDTQQTVTVKNDAGPAPLGFDMTKAALPWGDAGRVYDAFEMPVGANELVYEIKLSEQVGGFILLDAGGDRELYTYVEQRSTVVDQPISMTSSLSDGSKIMSLYAVVRSPSGDREIVQAEINEQRIQFTPSTVGAHAVQVYAEFADQDNGPMMLSTQHVIEVAQPSTPFGAAEIIDRDDLIEIVFDDSAHDGRVILAAEVWGRVGNEMVPVCWLSRVCGDERSLFLDTRWVVQADVDPQSLELRQLRAHDVDSMVPIQLVDRVPIPVDPALVHVAELGQLLATALRVPIEVIAHDLQTSSSRGALPGGHRLLLVHGYCSDGNPFTTSHFSGDVAVFHDPGVSRSQDGFALQLLAQTAPMKSFGVVGHSQGPMAAMHLYTFYFSGLDWARGERLIQSIGAPFTGTALAGNAAVLGDIFGFGCGENPDLSYAGASNWLSLIPTSTRQNVWYATTSFEDRPFAFDYCNLITDLLLSDPDDGVIERSAGQLTGGNSLGHVEGWCHTSDMRDPGQCTDVSRNTQFDTRARR